MIFRTVPLARVIGLGIVVIANVVAVPLSSAQNECVSTLNIDTPSANAAVQGTTTFSGWASVSGATTDSGISAITIWDGLQGQGGTLLGSASRVSRPDVDAAIGQPSFGFAFDADLSRLSAGVHTFSISGDTVCGTVSQLIALAVSPPPPPAASAPSVTGSQPSPSYVSPLNSSYENNYSTTFYNGNSNGTSSPDSYSSGYSHNDGYSYSSPGYTTHGDTPYVNNQPVYSPYSNVSNSNAPGNYSSQYGGATNQCAAFGCTGR